MIAPGVPCSRDVLDVAHAAGAENIASVMFTRLFSDYSSSCLVSPAGVTAEDTIDLPNLWRLKEEPTTSTFNMRIDNSVTCEEEIRPLVNLNTRLSSSTVTCIIDVSGSDVSGRNIIGLRKLAASIGSSIRIYSTTSPLPPKDGISIEKSVSHMRSELLAGIVVNDDFTEGGSTAHPKAVAVSCEIAAPFDSTDTTDLTADDLFKLRACGELHKQMTADAELSDYSPPLLLIGTARLYRSHAMVLNTLQHYGADLSHVVILNLHLDMETVSYFSELVTTYTCAFCFDGWGQGAVFAPIDSMIPSDDVMVRALLMLIERIAAAGQVETALMRVILSLNVYCKLQLRGYGGYGYDHLQQRITSRILQQIKETPPSCFYSQRQGAEWVRRMTSVSPHDLICWRPSPQLAEAPVEMLTCYFCGVSFVAGDHFSKFEFVYCSSKCLAAHRKRNWERL